MGDSNFQSAGVVGTLNCCAFSLYNFGILNTTVSRLDLIYYRFIVPFSDGVQFHYLASTLCMCGYVFNVIN